MEPDQPVAGEHRPSPDEPGPVDDHERFAARHAPDALLVVDGAGTLVYASPSAGALTGFDPRSQLGTSVFDKVHPDDLGYALGALQETVRKDGLHIPVHLRIAQAGGGWR